MEHRPIGLLVIALGIVVVIIGALIASGGLSWFGRLPGDIRIEHGNARVYIPIASMLVVSLVLSVISYLVRRFF
ncbi:MAG TPA: DUF2905 domain-containing protein [Gemmatimonadaceae bacterium]|jgi:hypothetical protein|nr:DUF2905 domain-containing protein [Gemmatimonadaceae bacterium]